MFHWVLKANVKLLLSVVLVFIIFVLSTKDETFFSEQMATGYQGTEPSSRFCEVVKIGRIQDQRNIRPHEVTLFYKYKSGIEGGTQLRSFFTAVTHVISTLTCYFYKVWYTRWNNIRITKKWRTTHPYNCHYKRANIWYPSWSGRRLVNLRPLL